MKALLSQLRLLYKPIKRFLQRHIQLVIIMLIIVFAIVQGLSSLNIIRGPWATILPILSGALALIFAILPWSPSFTSTKARDRMDNAINEYESIRHYTSPGWERMRNMEKVMMSMEGLAQQANYSSKEIKKYFEKREGERIAGLAILQSFEGVDHQYVDYFEQVLTLMNNPLSPYEHYRTIEMLNVMWLALTPTRQEQLWRDVRSHTRDWHASNSETSMDWDKFYQWIDESISQSLKNVEGRNGSYFEQVLTLMNEPCSPVLKLMNEPCFAYQHYLTLEMLKMMWPDLTPTHQEHLWRDVRSHTRDWHASNSETSEEWGKFYQWVDESISKGV